MLSIICKLIKCYRNAGDMEIELEGNILNNLKINQTLLHFKYGGMGKKEI